MPSNSGRSDSRNYYVVLGLQENATLDEVKKA